MRYLYTLLAILLTSCSTINVNEQAFTKNVSGKCYSAQTSLTVYYANTILTIISPKYKELPWRAFLAPWKKAFILEEGALNGVSFLNDDL